MSDEQDVRDAMQEQERLARVQTMRGTTDEHGRHWVLTQDGTSGDYVSDEDLEAASEFLDG